MTCPVHMPYKDLNVASLKLQPILHDTGSLGCWVSDAVGDQARTVPKDRFWIRTTWHLINWAKGDQQMGYISYI